MNNPLRENSDVEAESLITAFHDLSVENSECSSNASGSNHNLITKLSNDEKQIASISISIELNTNAGLIENVESEKSSLVVIIALRHMTERQTIGKGVEFCETRGMTWPFRTTIEEIEEKTKLTAFQTSEKVEILQKPVLGLIDVAVL
ncbi:hypothetical protein Ancab_017354 [Ancistrocladus abbreviatus]